MNLYAFYVLRGHSLGELAALTEGERLFLAAAREIYSKELTNE